MFFVSWNIEGGILKGPTLLAIFKFDMRSITSDGVVVVMLITWSDFLLDFFTNIKGVSNLFWVSDCFIIVYNTCW